MNRIPVVQACLLVVFALMTQSMAFGAQESQTVGPDSTALSLQVLSERLNAFEEKLETLTANAMAATTDQEEIASIELQLQALRTELQLLRDSGSSFNRTTVSSDVVVSRGGTAFVPATSNPRFSPGSEPVIPAATSAGVEISGFMDAIFESNPSAEQPNSARLNQVEVDLAREIDSRASASLGIIYGDGFDIGVAQVTYLLKPQSDESHSPLKQWAVSAGQFDVPFGEDVGCYASNVRKSVSIPTVVEVTHCLWNDVGMQTNAVVANTSIDLWAVRGFGLMAPEESSEEMPSLNLTSGLRGNVQIRSDLRVGASYSLGWLSNGEPAMQLYGAHGVWSAGHLEITGEGIEMRQDVIGESMLISGGYLTTTLKLDPFFILSRADYVRHDNDPWQDGYSLGSGVALGQGFEFRAEGRYEPKLETTSALLQVVASF